MLVDTGQKFIQALEKYLMLVPHISYPHAVFFLHENTNFTKIWYIYLGAGLHTFGYKVTKVDVQRLYANVMSYLSFWSALWITVVSGKRYKILHTNISQCVRSGPGLHELTVFSRGGGEGVSSEQMNTQAMKAVPKPALEPTPDYCNKCAASQNTVSSGFQSGNRWWTGQSLDAGYHWPTQRNKCNPYRTPLHKDGTPKQPKPILHLDDPWLNLEFHEADKEQLEQCGQHLLLFVDTDSEAKKLLEHHKQLTKVKPVTRSPQFDGYSARTMIPFSPQVAAGGAPADALQMYEGILAATQEDLHAMFNHAEDALIIHETVHACSPSIARNVQDDMAAAEHLGEFGTTLFSCDGYVYAEGGFVCELKLTCCGEPPISARLVPDPPIPQPQSGHRSAAGRSAPPTTVGLPDGTSLATKHGTFADHSDHMILVSS
ncbi:hypothetical protein B0H19DRAFT_1085209 [Mycena capillaripes]|nr:hypothetical protein B0H19DRAFT_1085209 [Mycena capillaripes]